MILWKKKIISETKTKIQCCTIYKMCSANGKQQNKYVFTVRNY